MEYAGFYLLKVKSDVHLSIRSAGHSGMEDGNGRTQA